MKIEENTKELGDYLTNYINTMAAGLAYREIESYLKEVLNILQKGNPGKSEYYFAYSPDGRWFLYHWDVSFEFDSFDRAIRHAGEIVTCCDSGNKNRICDVERGFTSEEMEEFEEYLRMILGVYYLIIKEHTTRIYTDGRGWGLKDRHATYETIPFQNLPIIAKIVCMQHSEEKTNKQRN